MARLLSQLLVTQTANSGGQSYTTIGNSSKSLEKVTIYEYCTTPVDWMVVKQRSAICDSSVGNEETQLRPRTFLKLYYVVRRLPLKARREAHCTRLEDLFLGERSSNLGTLRTASSDALRW